MSDEEKLAQQAAYFKTKADAARAAMRKAGDDDKKANLRHAADIFDELAEHPERATWIARVISIAVEEIEADLHITDGADDGEEDDSAD